MYPTVQNCLPYYPQNPDTIAEVIHRTTSDFIREHKEYPTEAQVWTTLRTNPPKSYAIFSEEYANEEHVSIADKRFGRNAFRKRWQKYTKKRTPAE
jgi:hypothetical protein